MATTTANHWSKASATLALNTTNGSGTGAANIGDLMVALAIGTTSLPSGGNVTTWTSAQTESAGLIEAYGTTTSTGAATLTGGSGATDQVCLEFTAGATGTWAPDKGANGSFFSATLNTYSEIPTASGETCVVGWYAAGSPAAGSTSGYTYIVVGDLVVAYDPSCGSGAQAPTATQTSGTYYYAGELFVFTPATYAPSGRCSNISVMRSAHYHHAGKESRRDSGLWKCRNELVAA